MKEVKFHSGYIVDVVVAETIALKDSSRSIFYVDPKDKDIVLQFKQWMKNIFLKGIPQTLTVVEYEDRGEDPDMKKFIKKFYNV